MEGNMGASDKSITAIADQMVRELALRGNVRTFPKHSLIINQGERGAAMYVVLAGKVQIYVSNSRGREMVLDEYGCGEYFGEMALDGSPRSASVRALEPTTCSVLDTDILRESLKNPEMALQLVLVLIERARGATESAMKSALTDVYTRVCELMLSQARDNGDGTRTIPDRITQKWIANRVGAQRDMVSKICIQLIKGDYLRVENRIYTILRPLPEKF